MVVDQLPAVAAAYGVMGKKDVARVHDELVTASGGEPQGPGERDHVLTVRGGMPCVRSTRRGDGRVDTQRVLDGYVEIVFSLVAFAVIAGPQFDQSTHVFALLPRWPVRRPQ